MPPPNGYPTGDIVPLSGVSIYGWSENNQYFLPLAINDLGELIVAPGSEAYTESTASGTTTNSYVAIGTFDVRTYHRASFVLSNTGATNTLHYKITTRSYTGGLEYEHTVETLMVPGQIEQVLFDAKHATILIYVKAAVSGSQTTYRLDAMLGKA